MIWTSFSLALIATSPATTLGLVALDDEPATKSLAEQLYDELSTSATPHGLPPRTAKILSGVVDPELFQQYSQAHEAYVVLDTGTALRTLDGLITSLLSLQDLEAARQLLAKSLRLRALIQLALKDPPTAAKSFTEAWLIEPEFSPIREEWPPEARLAFGDAIAAAKRSGTGVLSIAVEPADTVLWLDGKRVGYGATTLENLEPGSHFLMGQLPGYEPRGAIVTVEGGGKLSQAQLFLSAKAADLATAEELSSLADSQQRAMTTPKERALAAKRVCKRLGASHLALLSSNAGVVELTLLDNQGKQQGKPLMAGETKILAQEIELRLTETGTTQAATPWYDEPLWWVVGAAAVVATVGAVYWLTREDDSDRVQLYIGKAPQE